MMLISGLCCGLVSVSIALDPATPATGANSTSWWLFVGLVVVPMLITGAASAWLGWRQFLLRRTTDQHHQILRLADHHGAVTATDVARDLMLPLPNAEKLLDHLAASGICRMEISPEGTTMFIFPKRIIP